MLTAMGARGDQQLGMPYEIWVVGELGEALSADLGASSVEVRSGRTRLVVDVIDQSHLHGVLEKLRDFNVEIERVNPA